MEKVYTSEDLYRAVTVAVEEARFKILDELKLATVVLGYEDRDWPDAGYNVAKQVVENILEHIKNKYNLEWNK